MITVTVTVIDGDRVIVDSVEGEAYAIRRNGTWLWDKSGRIVGVTVVRAIDREIARASSGVSPPR